MNRAERAQVEDLLGVVKIVYADGIHDDTEALQRLFDGGKVVDREGNTFGIRDFILSSIGVYKISRPFIVDKIKSYPPVKARRTYV